eukprot:c40014_g1_i1 orf=189-458(+)
MHSMATFCDDSVTIILLGSTYYDWAHKNKPSVTAVHAKPVYLLQADETKKQRVFINFIWVIATIRIKVSLVAARIFLLLEFLLLILCCF